MGKLPGDVWWKWGGGGNLEAAEPVRGPLQGSRKGGSELSAKSGGSGDAGISGQGDRRQPVLMLPSCCLSRPLVTRHPNPPVPRALLPQPHVSGALGQGSGLPASALGLAEWAGQGGDRGASRRASRASEITGGFTMSLDN